MQQHIRLYNTISLFITVYNYKTPLFLGVFIISNIYKLIGVKKQIYFSDFTKKDLPEVTPRMKPS